MEEDKKKDILATDLDSYFGEEDIKKANEVSDIYTELNRVAGEERKNYLDACNMLGPRDLFLAVLIANGYDLDIAFLKAIHFDNPKMYLMKKSVLLRSCKEYISSNKVLCVAVAELRDTALQEYTNRAKINKNLVMCELIKLKDLCMGDPSSYKVALDSLKLIGQELGMFNNNLNNKALSSAFTMDTGAGSKDMNISISNRIDEMMIPASFIDITEASVEGLVVGSDNGSVVGSDDIKK